MENEIATDRVDDSLEFNFSPEFDDLDNDNGVHLDPADYAGDPEDTIPTFGALYDDAPEYDPTTWEPISLGDPDLSDRFDLDDDEE